MSDQPSPSLSQSDNQERLAFLAQIEKQRDLIQDLLSQVQSLQNLSEGLSKLFKNTGNLSPEIQKAFYLLDTLDNEQKNLSTAKVELRLEHLEIKIRDEVSYYLDLINSLDDLKDESDRHETLQELTSFSRIKEFKRKVSLALAYRVLLFERDATPSDFNLDVAPDLLSSSLKKVDKRKNLLKTELTTHFSSLHDSVMNFAKKASTSKPMASALYKIADQIKVNLEHLKSSKPSDELPASISQIEDLIKQVAETRQTSNTESALPQSDEARKESEDKQKKQGLFGRINVWINTPDSTTWKDTKKK